MTYDIRTFYTVATLDLYVTTETLNVLTESIASIFRINFLSCSVYTKKHRPWLNRQAMMFKLINCYNHFYDWSELVVRMSGNVLFNQRISHYASEVKSYMKFALLMKNVCMWKCEIVQLYNIVNHYEYLTRIW